MSDPTAGAAQAAFIAANTVLRPVPHATPIVLHTADEATPLWLKTEEDLGAVGLPPPFWAFAWAGGQALARYVLDQPDIVAGRTVLDFAAGSGLVGIAAKLAGAAHVTAADIDAYALVAIALNAAANGVTLGTRGDDIIGTDDGWDVVLAGDIFYERTTASRVTDWLQTLARRGALVLVGDPGRSYLPREHLTMLASYVVPVTRDLEDQAIKLSAVYRFA